MPRSIRPGWSASSTLNVSATFRAEWFGSMMPPDPTRIRSVCVAMWAIITSGLELAIPAVLWCSASQYARVPQRVREASQVDRARERLRRRRPRGDGRYVEDRQALHVQRHGWCNAAR